MKNGKKIFILVETFLGLMVFCVGHVHVFGKKEKSRKNLEQGIVLSSSYKNVLENKNYVLTNFYMYISASKNGSQYLDSLGGVAGVSASGSYTCNTFLLEAEERRKESL